MQQVQRATENYDANVGETVKTIGKIILISTWAFEVHKYWIWGNTKNEMLTSGRIWWKTFREAILGMTVSQARTTMVHGNTAHVAR